MSGLIEPCNEVPKGRDVKLFADGLFDDLLVRKRPDDADLLGPATVVLVGE